MAVSVLLLLIYCFLYLPLFVVVVFFVFLFFFLGGGGVLCMSFFGMHCVMSFLVLQSYQLTRNREHFAFVLLFLDVLLL